VASTVAIAAVAVAVADLALIVVCFRRRAVLGAVAGVAGVGAVVLAAVHGCSGALAEAAVVIAAILLIVGAVLLGLGQAFERLLGEP
jgi:hypothetical protein